MKKVFIVSLLLCIYTLLCSHEFWLQPDRFFYRKGDKVNIKFRVGENFKGENWTGDRSKVNFLELLSTGTTTDLSSHLKENKGDSLQFVLAKEGTAMIIYSGLNSFIELEAAKFNAYLAEDGLRETVQYRKEHQETDSAGREHYQRSVKTIIQVGEKYDTVFRQITSLPIDIIPQENPYLVRDRQKLTVMVLFHKKPLKDQLVKVWFRQNDKTLSDDLLTDEQGLVSFRIKRAGQWMVSTVKMIRVENDPKADWQSYWGSCTWGYE